MKVAKLEKDLKGLTQEDQDKSIATIAKAPILPKNPVKTKPIPPQIDTDDWGLWNDQHGLFKSDGYFVIKNPSKFKQTDKQRYEWFIGGFLYFYDAEIRNNTVDHVVYFEWVWTAKEKKVRLWLSPKPAQNPYFKNSPTGGRTDPPSPPPPPPPPMG